MKLFVDIMLSIFTVFGVYCATLEIWRFVVSVVSKHRKNRRNRFDNITVELYNKANIKEKESDNVKKHDGQ